MEPVQTVQPATPDATTGEPCPTPLEWRDVVAGFRRERDDFELEVQGARVQAAIFGTGHPLYFLSPATGNIDLFALLAWRLREQFRCVLVDEPRPHPQRTQRLSQARSCLLAAADHVGDDSFSLFATGWGSLVALQSLLSVPNRIPAAILVCGFAHRDLTWIERGLLFWGCHCPGRLAQLPAWQTIQERNHRAWFPPYDETRWQFLRDNLAATPIRDAARRLAVLSTTDLRPRLSEIKARVLLVRTEGEGPQVTKCQEDLQTGIPAATTEWMHTSGHYSCLTHPHRLAKLVTAFLTPAP